MNNLAALYIREGRTSEGETLLKRALSIRQTAFGPDHPDVGNSLNNLAALYSREGRYSEAEPMYHQSLEITEKFLSV